jgi:hypothetical protein
LPADNQTTTTEERALGHRQPLPGEPEHDAWWYDWMRQWRGDILTLARKAKAQGMSVQVQARAHYDACDTCKSHSGQRFDPDAAPEPPVAECASSRRCRCTYVLYMPDYDTARLTAEARGRPLKSYG